MWRLAVSTKKQAYSHIAFWKSLRLAFKHTDSRVSYLRALSNDASSVRIENDRPIKEVFSLEDFGLLSLSKSPSLETTSSFENESTFIEQLLKNENFSNFSSIHIPTTVDSKELGGSSEDFGYDHATELLSEGADAELVAEELNDIPSVYHQDDQTPSTSKSNEDDDVVDLPFLIPSMIQEDPQTRKVLSERVRRERKLNLSTTTIEKPVYQNGSIGEMMFPESIAEDRFVSQWEDTPRLVNEKSAEVERTNEARDMEFSLEVLEGMLTEETSMELLKELKTVEWPEYVFTEGGRTINRANCVLRFGIQHSSNPEEAEMILKRFSQSHILAVVSDDILINVISKFANILDFNSLEKKMSSIMDMCIKREMRPNWLLMKTSLEELYCLMFNKDFKSAHSVFVKCCELNFDKSPELFMKCHAESIRQSNTDFLTGFSEWKKLSKKYGRTCGIDSFWMAALAEENGVGQSKMIDAILTHCNKTDHPFATIGAMITTFVKLNEMEKALEVFRTVSISGRHFKGPLLDFVEKCNLECIERLANLVERGMIAERRRNPNNKTVKEGEKLLDEHFYAVLAKFYGIGGAGRKKKFVDKKLKRKIHRVDEEQLHELCKSLQRAWIQCAEEKNDQESAKRLSEWCLRNRVEIDEKISRRVLNLN